MKITRKSYNRKVLSFGVVMFLAVALISTGFATWVMSNEATEDETGNINVGTITDGSLSITDLAFKDDVKDFHFEPLATDQSGDIQYQNPESDPNNFSENLEVTITGKVTPSDYLGDFTIKMDELPVGVRNAATAGYIVLPDCHAAAQNIDKTDLDTSTPLVLDFEYKIEFAWGDKFNGQNPSVFLDSDTAKNGTEEYTFEEKRDILVEFRRTIFDLPEEAAYNPAEHGNKDYMKYVMEYVPEAGHELTYNVTITAKPNI